jgi:hypothetical protein
MIGCPPTICPIFGWHPLKYVGFTCEELIGLLWHHPSLVAHYYTEIMGNPPNSQSASHKVLCARETCRAEQSRAEQTKNKVPITTLHTGNEFCCSGTMFLFQPATLVLCNFNVDFCCKKLQRHDENTLQPCDHRKW